MEWFIQLHRKMLDWEWYEDINTKVLFIHLLLKANWKDKNWRWQLIERWSFITSYQKLSDETGLSIQQVRTSINKLKSTHDITYLWQASNSLIKLTNYNEYQGDNTEVNTLATNEQQTSNKRVTTTNKDNNNNKDNKEIKNKYWEYQKILLTLAQYNKLIEDFWETTINEYIKRVDEYIQMKWAKYKDHNLVIRNWINKDWNKTTHEIENISLYEKQKEEKLKRLYWEKRINFI